MIDPFPSQPPSTSPAVCSQCGKKVPVGVSLCESCVAALAKAILDREDRNHRGDVVTAVIAFGVANLLLISVTRDDPFSQENMLARLVFLGLPFAWTAAKWYRLMRSPDPDYGELWHIYWKAQMLTVGAALGLVMAFAVVVGIAALVLPLIVGS